LTDNDVVNVIVKIPGRFPNDGAERASIRKNGNFFHVWKRVTWETFADVLDECGTTGSRRGMSCIIGAFGGPWWPDWGVGRVECFEELIDPAKLYVFFVHD